MIEKLENLMPGKKSLTAALGVVLAGIAGYLSGEYGVTTMLVVIFNGLGIAGLKLAKKEG